MRDGIDYEKMMDIRLNISRAKMNSWDETPQDKVKRNIRDMNNLSVGDWSRRKYGNLMDHVISQNVRVGKVRDKKRTR